MPLVLLELPAAVQGMSVAPPLAALLWRGTDATIAGFVVVGIAATLWFTW
jgi:hypothetical protein